MPRSRVRSAGPCCVMQWLQSVLAVALGLGLFSGLDHPATYNAEFRTALGERRQVALPDGSLMDLNSRSVVAVHYVKGQRGIELKQGEAMFSVEHDTSRPFVVDAGAGQVTVTGTRFDVRRDDDQTRVVVEAGTVKVQGRSSDDIVMLTAVRAPCGYPGPGGGCLRRQP